MTALHNEPVVQPVPGQGDNIASTKGLAAGKVGQYVPAFLLLGFIPMLLVAFAYRELNNAVPDSGTSFTWETKAFGPWVGWMGGWGLITATILVLSNLAAVAVDFFYLLLAQVTGNDAIAEWTRNLWINIPTTIVFIAVAAYVSYRGLDSTQKLQYILVAVQILAIVIFDIVAIVHAYNIIFRFLFPLVGGGFLLIMFFVTAYDSLNPDYGSGSSILGVGTVFVLGMGILLLGAVLMFFTRVRHPDFFKGRMLERITSNHDDQIPMTEPADAV